MPALVTLVDGTVPVASDFNGNYSALNQVCGTTTSYTGYTTGDLIYASAATALSKLVIGTNGQVLAVIAGLPAWTAPAGLNVVAGLALSNNAGDATNDIDIAVGATMSDDATVANRALMSLTSGLTKQLDAAWAVGTNQGMRASGAAIANGTYHIFLIMRPDTGVIDIAADTSATGANVAANTNAAYTKIRRIGSILREAASLVAFVQDGDLFARKATVTDVSANNPGTAAVTRTLSVPVGIKVQVIFDVSLSNTTSGAFSYGWFSDLAANDEAPGPPGTNHAHLAANNASNGQARVVINSNTSAQVRSRVDASDANTNLYVRTAGWIDTRGRNS